MAVVEEAVEEMWPEILDISKERNPSNYTTLPLMLAGRQRTWGGGAGLEIIHYLKHK